MMMNRLRKISANSYLCGGFLRLLDYHANIHWSVSLFITPMPQRSRTRDFLNHLAFGSALFFSVRHFWGSGIRNQHGEAPPCILGMRPIKNRRPVIQKPRVLERIIMWWIVADLLQMYLKNTQIITIFFLLNFMLQSAQIVFGITVSDLYSVIL